MQQPISITNIKELTTQNIKFMGTNNWTDHTRPSLKGLGHLYVAWIGHSIIQIPRSAKTPYMTKIHHELDIHKTIEPVSNHRILRNPNVSHSPEHLLESVPIYDNSYRRYNSAPTALSNPLKTMFWWTKRVPKSIFFLTESLSQSLANSVEWPEWG